MATKPRCAIERHVEQKPATEAYEISGFSPSRSHPSELENSWSISERVSELLAEREKVHGQATAAAVERVASVIRGTEKVGKINMLTAQAMAI